MIFANNGDSVANGKQQRHAARARGGIRVEQLREVRQ